MQCGRTAASNTAPFNYLSSSVPKSINASIENLEACSSFTALLSINEEPGRASKGDLNLYARHIYLMVKTIVELEAQDRRLRQISRRYCLSGLDSEGGGHIGQGTTEIGLT